MYFVIKYCRPPPFSSAWNLCETSATESCEEVHLSGPFKRDLKMYYFYRLQMNNTPHDLEKCSNVRLERTRELNR